MGKGSSTLSVSQTKIHLMEQSGPYMHVLVASKKNCNFIFTSRHWPASRMAPIPIPVLIAV